MTGKKLKIWWRYQNFMIARSNIIANLPLLSLHGLERYLLYGRHRRQRLLDYVIYLNKLWVAGAFTRLQVPLQVTLEGVTAYLQRLESKMPPDQCESLARALMQRHSLRYAARLDASGAMLEPVQVILFLHFDLIRSNKSIIRCYIL
jgi:hypothetical protein